MAGELAQLPARVVEVAGLPDGTSVEVGDLVRADNPRRGELAPAGFGLEARETYRGVARKLAGKRAFIDVGRPYLERNAQAFQQALAVFRPRGEYD
jgi:hypothetical protein